MAKAPTYRVISNPVATDPEDTGELTVLFAGESQTAPVHRVGPKIVDYYLLHHVISGRGTFTAGDVKAELTAGHSFLILPKQLIGYVSDAEEPWRYRWVAFAGKQAAALAEAAGLGLGRPIAYSGALRTPADCSRHIFEAFKSRKRSASLEATGYLHLLLAALRESAPDASPSTLRPDSHAEELVRQVSGYLSTQYAEPVTIETMAEALGYNRAYLSRVFKRHTGMTPIAFLTQARVDHGRRLLRERPELTVEQIASSVGFRDALYFSKQFRRSYGEAPTDYRRSVLK